MPGPSLGMNLSGVVDYTVGFPFIDQFRFSRDWYTQREGVFDTGQASLLDLDRNGWVRDFTKNGAPAPFEQVSTILWTAGDHVRTGVYVLDWKGAGTLELGLVSPQNIISQTNGKIVFRVTDATSPIQLSILNTDPQNNGNYIRDIRVYHSDDRELINAGKILTPEFLEKIQDFRVLRFMDWGNTNNSDVRHWSDRTVGDAARESTDAGVSVETMVALANEAHVDPWFNIPHLADNDYIRKFATYVKNHLDPGLVARFEFSNEVWNFGFGQSQHALARARALWGEDVGDGYMQWYGMKAANMARIVADVFGDETGTRALNVFATQAGWTGLEQSALNAPNVVEDGGRAPKTAPFHVYAIAPYFDGNLSSGENDALVQQWISQGEAGFVAAIDFVRNSAGPGSLAGVVATIAYHAAQAEALGWQLEAYEAGQHIVEGAVLFGGESNPDIVAFFVELVKRPEFATLYAEYFETWKENGGGLMAHFSDFGEGGKYGSWGVWDSIFSENSPRADAIEQFRDSVAVWWHDPRRASVFENGDSRVDHDGQDNMRGTKLDDALSGLGGDNLIRGFGGDDLLFARGGRDTIEGGRGRDLIGSFGGKDQIAGGGGADTMTGGAGSDMFIFRGANDSRTGHRDVIRDFGSGDKIDMAAIDANSNKGGDQRFHFIGGRDFHETAGEVRTERVGRNTLVQVDVNGDGRADMAILLIHETGVKAGDFIL